ncbi:hypothetical protein [Micromonospora echinaurantiaca]|uniref:hypothetical protein n=1 Tax=Micromonospora echinaurantiaca TaxID=47857 RepID=UPI003438655C
MDHRIAVESFLQQQAWRLDPAPTSVTAHHADGSTLRVEFDALGRVSNMSGTVSP